ncbi:MAG: acyl carrier protein [Desulfobacterales bacterium]|nr:acyl carrier protein [Desulfobacterales bacterium]
MENTESVVHEVILKIAAEKKLDIKNIQNSQTLVADIGFKSIDLARIIAILESKLGVDPFSELVPITNIQTVGDLCNAYNLCFSQDNQAGCNVSFEQSKTRAQTRLNAAASRSERRKRIVGSHTNG